MAEGINTDQPVNRRLRLGIVGIGVGASEILPQMEAMPDIQLVAAADINRRVLSTFQHRYGAKTYDSIEKLCADPNVEAVWISTPNSSTRRTRSWPPSMASMWSWRNPWRSLSPKRKR